MLLIGEMAREIACELEYSEKYADKAMILKDEVPDISRKYAEIAKEELNHADMIHEMAVSLAKKAEGKATEAMAAYWKDTHESFIKKRDELSYRLSKM